MPSDIYDPRIKGENGTEAALRLHTEDRALDVQIRLAKIRKLQIAEDLDQCDRIAHLEWEHALQQMRARS